MLKYKIPQIVTLTHVLFHGSMYLDNLMKVKDKK